MSKSLSWRRVRALCVKETRQIVRDPSSWLIAVVIQPGNAGRQSFRESKVVAGIAWQPPAERTRRDSISAGVTDGRRF
ncbi:hypothetical protein MJI20_27575, partial [Salmonella enterica subsp. enterica serovar Anatum]|nr:hypothetical protein [Salmonella enterica subsp. enterica serovar Anatum]